MSEPRTVFLVPRRADNGPRDAIWEYCKARWIELFPHWPVVEGHHDDGPFNRSAAVNLAAELAGDWEVGIVIDSDVIISRTQLKRAVDLAVETQKVTWPHTRWRGLRKDATERLLDNWRNSGGVEAPGAELDRDELDLIVERTNPLSWSCCIVMPRSQFDALGGFDERFKGWGFEDMAFQSAVCGLLGWNRQKGDIVHLWHPRSEERIVPGQGRLTSSPEYIYNARLGRRYMVALRRDHSLHDRGDIPFLPGERERDIENLMRDDAKWSAAAKANHLPDWDGWWPTLEELVAGARESRMTGGATGSVAVIVRSGGTAEVADERLDYLARSLASLETSVKGPVVQRVVYSDWPDEIVPRVREIADRFGFYVAGAGHHGYVLSTQRLWRYINDRVKADYVFLAEDDFLYLKEIDLAAMVGVLSRVTRVKQIALLRAPAYQREFEGESQGAILGWDKDSFTIQSLNGESWMEHRNFWTMNPSLFRKNIVRNPWPEKQNSERIFGDRLLKDPVATVAFWGTGDPWMQHIGETRAGGPY